MKFGADNLFKKLRAVLVAKPLYFDIATLETPWQKKWFGQLDRTLAIKQHENMCIALENEGVKCHFLNPVKEDPDQKDSREFLFYRRDNRYIRHWCTYRRKCKNHSEIIKSTNSVYSS